MVMNLYYGGFGKYNEFVVADSEEQAISKVGAKINAPFLPIKVTEIAEVDGYIVQIANATFAEKPIEAEKVEIKSEISLRHCKKCDFTCETQGQLLAHYREFHSKGD